MTLTAAAASALVAGATVALPAIGDDSGPSPAKPAGDHDVAAFAACLTDHGLAGAPTAGEDLKPWLAQKEAADPQATKAAIDTCQKLLPQKPPERRGVDVKKLAACMRSHGLDAPSDPAAFKAWFKRQEADDPDAIKRIVPDCKGALDVSPSGPAKPGDGKPNCGEPAPKADEDATPLEPAASARQST